MNKKQLNETCEKIIKCVTLSPKDVDISRCDFFMRDYVTVYIIDNNYYSLTYQLFEHYSNKKISFSELTKIKEQLIIKNNFSFDNFDKAVNDKKEKEYTSIKKVYGIHMKNHEQITLGKYTILNEEVGLSAINEKISSDEMKLKPTKRSIGDTCVYVLVTVKACDIEYAKELVNKELINFTNMLRFFIGARQVHNRIDIKNITSTIDTSIAYSSDEVQITNELGDLNLHPVCIDFNDFINCKEYGFDKIWDIDKKASKSEIEKRIIESIVWLGKAIGEYDNSIACMECMFSVESLLKISDEFLSKSIGAQLKEAAAFVMSENKEDRMEIDKIIGDMFINRSIVAHGKSKSISNKDLSLYFSTVRELIIRFNLKNFNDIDDFKNYIMEQRYK